jgi:hypothetical protein
MGENYKKKIMKIAILGLGQSLEEFVKEDYDLCIGVNDIWRFVHADAVVCLDHRKVFNADRISYIDNCNPKAFYSHIVNWDVRSDFQKIDFLPGYPDHVCRIDQREYQKSYCSPFVAAQIAWKIYRATEIHLFGIDMTDHPHLDHALCSKIKRHFKNLKAALLDKNCQMIVHGEGILKDL